MKSLTVCLVAATLLVGVGCAKQDWIDRTLVTVDVTGTWYGTGAGSGGAEVWLDLVQTGATVKGFVRITPNQGINGPIDGSVAGDVFQFKAERGPIGGELTISGDEMSGAVAGPAGRRQVSLRRVDKSSPQASPPR